LQVAQQRALEDIKRYLSLPPVMKAPMAEIPFGLYIAAEDAMTRAVLTQVTEGKEHIITYLSRASSTPKQGTISLKSCVYLCSMLVPNYVIICHLALVLLCVKPM
jgi:hypothetical protein